MSVNVKMNAIYPVQAAIFQFSEVQVYVFSLAAFVHFSYLTHFAITSLVVFAELSILRCSEVVRNSGKSFNLRLILSAILFIPAEFCRSRQSFLISLFCTQFPRFASNFTFLHCSPIWN